MKRIVPDAPRIALRSYSMWANYLGILALILPEVIFWIWGIDTNPRLWWSMGLILILLGILGRLINQGITNSPFMVLLASIYLAMAQVPSAQPSAEPYSTQEFLSEATPLIAKWEGLRTTAYRDIVGVWTVCYGETKGVRPGDSYTPSECKDMLAREILSYRNGWREYLTAETKRNYLHAPREAAFVSLAYNVGIRGAGRSTATKRLNSGNISGACTAIGWWNKAGGRVVRGLVNRRSEEVRMCRQGVA